MATHRRGLPGGVPAIRVALDTTPLQQTRGGTARYVRGLRDHLSAEIVELSYPATSRLRTAVCDLTWYPRLRAPDNVDVLHCPTFRGPFRSSTPLVVTVHDLAVLRHPEWFNRWTRAYSSFAVPRVVRAARRVIAVSEFTKRELVALRDNDVDVVGDARAPRSYGNAIHEAAYLARRI